MWHLHELQLAFVVANALIAFAYFVIGVAHMWRHIDPLMGTFIFNCGLGHAAMAWSAAVVFSPVMLVTTHGITSVVSVLYAYRVVRDD